MTQPLALFLCVLALREVEYECQGLAPALINHRGRNQCRHAAAVAAKVLLFEEFAGAARSELRRRPLTDDLPFRRRKFRPSKSSRVHVVTRIPDHPEKGVIGLEYLAIKIRDQYPDNIGVHQAPDLRFAFLE